MTFSAFIENFAISNEWSTMQKTLISWFFSEAVFQKLAWNLFSPRQRNIGVSIDETRFCKLKFRTIPEQTSLFPKKMCIIYWLLKVKHHLSDSSNLTTLRVLRIDHHFDVLMQCFLKGLVFLIVKNTEFYPKHHCICIGTEVQRPTESRKNELENFALSSRKAPQITSQ